MQRLLARTHLVLLLLHLLHFSYFLGCLPGEIIDGGSQHLGGGFLNTGNGIQTNHHFGYRRCHVSAALHSLPPGEGTISILQLLQLLHLILQTDALLREILLWLFFQREMLLDMGGDGIGVDGRHQRDGILLIRIADRRQRLDHQPTWIVGIFHGHLCILCSLRLLALLVQEKFAQVEVLLTLLMQGDRQGVHHEFTVAQNRQVMLFTIAVAITGSHHLIYIYTFFQSRYIKGDDG